MADAQVGLLAGIGQRFLDFCERFGGYFRQRTRTVATSVQHYVRGLLQAQPPAVRVDHWAPQPPATAWQAVTLRDGTKGPLRVEILHRRVWLWDGQEAQARPWRRIVRREIDDPTEIK